MQVEATMHPFHLNSKWWCCANVLECLFKYSQHIYPQLIPKNYCYRQNMESDNWVVKLCFSCWVLTLEMSQGFAKSRGGPFWMSSPGSQSSHRIVNKEWNIHSRWPCTVCAKTQAGTVMSETGYPIYDTGIWRVQGIHTGKYPRSLLTCSEFTFVYVLLWKSLHPKHFSVNVQKA